MYFTGRQLNNVSYLLVWQELACPLESLPGRVRPLEEVSVDAFVALRRRAPVAVGILTAHPAAAAAATVPALLLLASVPRAALKLPSSLINIIMSSPSLV